MTNRLSIFFEMGSGTQSIEYTVDRQPEFKQTEKHKTLYKKAKQKMLHNQSIKCYNKQSTKHRKHKVGAGEGGG